MNSEVSISAANPGVQEVVNRLSGLSGDRAQIVGDLLTVAALMSRSSGVDETRFRKMAHAALLVTRNTHQTAGETEAPKGETDDRN
ncbi:MAG: hypothetical protein AAF415_13020 [Pseudomonadota bacterium]